MKPTLAVFSILMVISTSLFANDSLLFFEKLTAGGSWKTACENYTSNNGKQMSRDLFMTFINDRINDQPNEKIFAINRFFSNHDCKSENLHTLWRNVSPLRISDVKMEWAWRFKVKMQRNLAAEVRRRTFQDFKFSTQDAIRAWSDVFDCTGRADLSLVAINTWVPIPEECVVLPLPRQYDVYDFDSEGKSLRIYYDYGAHSDADKPAEYTQFTVINKLPADISALLEEPPTKAK